MFDGWRVAAGAGRSAPGAPPPGGPHVAPGGGSRGSGGLQSRA